MAADALTKALEGEPNNPEGHLTLARCFFGLGRQQKAREEIQIAIAQSSQPFSAYRLLGVIDITDKNYLGAIESFENAIRAAQAGDEQEAKQLQNELRDLQKLDENLKQFAALDAEQKSADIVRPMPLNSPQPRYTEEARRLRIQGPVGLAVLVNEIGDVDSVLLLHPLGGGLDQQAVNAVRELKFSPAQLNGKPIPYWTKVVVEFNLR